MENKRSNLLKRLLAITSESEIEEFLTRLSVGDSSKPPGKEEYAWKPVGGSLSNAANIHTTEFSIAPIIERITNSFDAAIEVKEYQSNKGRPLDYNSLPESPRRAVEHWWGIKNGDTAFYGENLSPEKRTEFARSIVEVILKESGNENQPTVLIKDAGIGQTPDEFTATLLKLGKSNKISKRHLHGTYGHGGSSSFRFSNYSIIVSRRHPCDAIKDSTSIGWTIVRKNSKSKILWDWEDKKLVEIKTGPVYEYLCYADGQIPRCPSIEIQGFVGTHIAHIAYQGKEWQNLSIVGYRFFRNYLFDPVLPYRLDDSRDKKTPFQRNMFGARSTLEKNENKDVRYKNESVENLSNSGKLTFRYWLLHDPLEPARRPLSNYTERQKSRNTIIVTLNGQRHGTLEKSLISKVARLPRVSDSLLVQVLVDEVGRELIGELGTSARSQLVQEGWPFELIQDKLVECLKDDTELQRWEVELSEIHIADDESTKEVTRLLDRLIDIGVDLGKGTADTNKVPSGGGSSREYTPNDPPTLLEIPLKEESD